MKTLLLVTSIFFTGSAFAYSTNVFCHAKTSKGEAVTLNFCISESSHDTVNAFAPCPGEPKPTVTLAYFDANPEGLDIDPIILQLPASEFNMSVDEEFLSMTTHEISNVGIFSLSYATQPENQEFNLWNFTVHDPADTKNALKLHGNFKKLSCNFQLISKN